MVRKRTDGDDFMWFDRKPEKEDKGKERKESWLSWNPKKEDKEKTLFRKLFFFDNLFNKKK